MPSAARFRALARQYIRIAPPPLGVDGLDEALDIDALDLAFRAAFDAESTSDDLSFVWRGGPPQPNGSCVPPVRARRPRGFGR